MAYYRKTNEEHAFKSFLKMANSASKSGAWPNPILLFGRESFLIDWAESEIKKRVVSPAALGIDCNVFDDEGFLAGEVTAACETLPALSKRRLVIIKNESLLSGQKGPPGAADEQKELTKYLPKLPKSSLLLLISQKIDKRKALYKAAALQGRAYDFGPLGEADLASWMEKRAKLLGKNAFRGDLIRYSRLAGYGDPNREYSMYSLDSDIKKAAALCEGSVLSFEDLCMGGGGGPETAAFTVLDAALSGDKGYALTVLHNNIASGPPSSETGVVLGFVGLLCSQLEIMLEASERSAEGESLIEIEKAMKINPYRLRKAVKALQGHTEEDLKRSLFKAFQIEKDLKNGILDARTSLELFIAGL